MLTMAVVIPITGFLLQRFNTRPVFIAKMTLFSTGTVIAVVMMAISMMALFGTIILLPIYTQTVLGLSALQAGLILLPGGLAMGLLASFVGRLYDRALPTDSFRALPADSFRALPAARDGHRARVPRAGAARGRCAAARVARRQRSGAAPAHHAERSADRTQKSLRPSVNPFYP